MVYKWYILPIGWLYTTDPTLYRNLKNPLNQVGLNHDDWGCFWGWSKDNREFPVVLGLLHAFEFHSNKVSEKSKKTCKNTGPRLLRLFVQAKYIMHCNNVTGTPQFYTPGSSKIAGWKMGAPEWVDVFPIKNGDVIPAIAMWSFTRE